MKRSVVAIVFAFSTSAWADTLACANLSHISSLGTGEVHVQQPSCDKWLRQGYFQGQPYGDVQEVVFSSSFTETNVDDQYEKYTSNQRWFWASPKQDILIHEYVIDSFDKSSSVATFTTGSEFFSMDGDKVKVSGQTQVRTTGANGQVKVSTKPVSASYERLK